MKEQEAISHLRSYMFWLQKYRSVGKENFGPSSGELCFLEGSMEKIWPWVWGDKCPLPSLVKVLDNVDNGNPLAPLDYYNLMFILLRFIPELAIVIRAMEGRYSTFPEDFIEIQDILGGWEE